MNCWKEMRGEVADSRQIPVSNDQQPTIANRLTRTHVYSTIFIIVT